jgi:hypothetical protein
MMPQWEYSKLDLNNVPARSSEIDLLDNAGRDGWELVRITANNFAYMKRALEEIAPEAPPRAKQPVRRKTAASRVSEE